MIYPVTPIPFQKNVLFAEESIRLIENPGDTFNTGTSYVYRCAIFRCQAIAGVYENSLYPVGLMHSVKYQKHTNKRLRRLLKAQKKEHKLILQLISYAGLSKEEGYVRAAKGTGEPVSYIIDYAGLQDRNEMRSVTVATQSIVREIIGEDKLCSAINRWRKEIANLFISTWLAGEYPRFEEKVLIDF